MKIEQMLTSMEVAEMVEKEHKMLLRDLRRYKEQLAEVNIHSGDFFTESTYKDANNQSRPCYRITKKGCEFIAHKLTGTKETFNEVKIDFVKCYKKRLTFWATIIILFIGLQKKAR